MSSLIVVIQHEGTTSKSDPEKLAIPIQLDQ